MGEVIRLDDRRRGEAAVDRLQRAVARIELALLGLDQEEAPAWLIREIGQLRSELAEGRHDDAAERAEQLAERLSRLAG